MAFFAKLMRNLQLLQRSKTRDLGSKAFFELIHMEGNDPAKGLVAVDATEPHVEPDVNTHAGKESSSPPAS